MGEEDLFQAMLERADSYRVGRTPHGSLSANLQNQWRQDGTEGISAPLTQPYAHGVEEEVHD